MGPCKRSNGNTDCPLWTLHQSRYLHSLLLDQVAQGRLTKRGQSRSPTGKQNTTELSSDLRWRYTSLTLPQWRMVVLMERGKLVSSKTRSYPLLIYIIFLQKWGEKEGRPELHLVKEGLQEQTTNQDLKV